MVPHIPSHQSRDPPYLGTGWPCRPWRRDVALLGASLPFVPPSILLPNPCCWRGWNPPLSTQVPWGSHGAFSFWL